MLTLLASRAVGPHNQDGRTLAYSTLGLPYSHYDAENSTVMTPGAAENITLTKVRHDLFITEILEALVQMQKCAARTEFINITDIKSAAVRVESGKEDGFTLQCIFHSRGTSTPNHKFDATVELTTFEDPEIFEISQIAPYDFFPACTRELIEQEIASGLHATSASTHAEQKIEASESSMALPHLSTDGNTTKRRLQIALRRQQAKAADFAPGGRFERHALGFIQEQHSAPLDLRPRNAISLMQSMPAEHHPFANNTCLHKFPARDQGQPTTLSAHHTAHSPLIRDLGSTPQVPAVLAMRLQLAARRACPTASRRRRRGSLSWRHPSCQRRLSSLAVRGCPSRMRRFASNSIRTDTRE